MQKHDQGQIERLAWVNRFDVKKNEILIRYFYYNCKCKTL